MKNYFKTKLDEFYDYFTKLNEQRIEDLKKKTSEISNSISKPVVKIISHSTNVFLYQNFNEWLNCMKKSEPKVVIETIIIDTIKFEHETLFSRVLLKDWLDDPLIIFEDDESNPLCVVFPQIDDLEIIKGVEYGFLSGGFLQKVQIYLWEDKKKEIKEKISEFSQFIDKHRNFAEEKVEEAEERWEEGMKQEKREIIDYCLNELKTNFFLDSDWKFEHIKKIRPEFERKARTYLKELLEQRQIPESEYYDYEKFIIEDLNDLYYNGKEFILDEILDVSKLSTELKDATNYSTRFEIIKKIAEEIPDGKLFTLTQKEMKTLFLEAKRTWKKSP